MGSSLPSFLQEVFIVYFLCAGYQRHKDEQDAEPAPKKLPVYRGTIAVESAVAVGSAGAGELPRGRRRGWEEMSAQAHWVEVMEDILG